MKSLLTLKKELRELKKNKPTLSKYNITKHQVELTKEKSKKEELSRWRFQICSTIILTLITFFSLVYYTKGFADNLVVTWAFLSAFIFSRLFYTLTDRMANELFPIKDDETIFVYNEYLNDLEENSSSIKKKKGEIEDYKNRLKQIEKQKKRDYWIEQDGYEFERSIAHLFEGLGYYVELTNKTGDEGVDMFLNNNTVVQCKATKSSVSPSVVRDLYGTMKHFKAQKGILVSTGGFTSGSIDFAMGKNIELWDMDKILSVSKGIELTE